MNPEKAYLELVRLSREERVLASCIDVLDWDQEIYMCDKRRTVFFTKTNDAWRGRNKIAAQIIVILADQKE